MTFARNFQEYRERRQAERAANLRALATVPAHRLHTGTYEGTTSPVKATPARKGAGRSDRAAEIRHKEKLVDLGCMVCRRLYPGLAPGPVELHHLRENGWGKGGYLTLMPLCVEHHRGSTGVHGLGTRGFVKHYGFTQADILRDALALIQPKEGCAR